MIMARYYFISKLDEKKAFKLIHDNDKDNIIFRDYPSTLQKIDQEKYARLLEAIGTEQARLAALWLKMLKKYSKDGLLRPCLSNPITQEMIANAKAYARKDNIVIKYNDVPIASFTYGKDMFKAIGFNEMLFNEALKLMIMKKEQDLKNGNFEYDQFIYRTHEDQDYDVSFSFLKACDYSRVKIQGKDKFHIIAGDAFIKELDVEKIGNLVYSIDRDEKIKISGNMNIIRLFDEALIQLDMSKIKNKYLRKLIRLRQRYDIFTSLLLINNKSAEEFGVKIVLNLNEKFPDSVMSVAWKMKIKDKIRSIKKDMNELKINGFLIKSDSSVEIIDYTQAARYFDMSFVIQEHLRR